MGISLTGVVGASLVDILHPEVNPHSELKTEVVHFYFLYDEF